ncbi:alpha-L-fucosidase [Chitinophaga sedimenti]|uniref:alpha-L-fucosidase n=1 Tax=Chitinophaga sedimenti TaxID=2033606 RepID=UPI00200442DA|nr:alpha-L-fucosidase [Chitinophaga sedimenti]MCK7557451.1 alpha-L-fucosidase [Chitinophaga sedimenti]
MFKNSFLIACLLLAQTVFAQKNAAPIPLKYGAQYEGKRTDEAMQKWRSNRFGQFIHWGLYAIPGGVWNGKTYNYAAEFLKSSARIPTTTWDSLMYQFNPKGFNAKAWAKMAKGMGVKYMTITTKHHEGFCLFPSKFTEFNIANTPYKKDILKELVDAYNAEGIDVNFYYSVLDWHHPDWRYDIKSEADSMAMVRLLKFEENQLRELAENYPTVKGFWFDGTWDNSIKKNGKWTYEMEMMLKKIRPGVVVNSRLRADDLGARHRDSNGKLMGDYESGYERRLPPATELKVTQWDWEACMTVPENQWGYHKDWSISHVKTPVELLEMLVHTTSMGGNFLLNFGPGGDGTFRKEEHNIADYIGKWMAKNSDAIVGCDYAGWDKQDWGYFTRRGKESKVNAIVFNVPVSGVLKIKVPAKTTIVKAYFKEGGKPVTVKEVAKDQYQLTLPGKLFATPPVIIIETSGGDNSKQYKDALT